MAIEISGVKHACASCIRGHRVKKCNHVEREMVPIPKRGRQISQCNHCRNLRKTHHTHVKCTCATSKSPNPMNGCLCEIVNSCSCVAHHLQDTSTSNTLPSSYNIPDMQSRSSSLSSCSSTSSSSSSSSSSSESPLFFFEDMFDLAPSMISSSSPSSSCCNNNNNNNTVFMNDNDISSFATTGYDNIAMLSPTDKPLMSLSVSELLDLPLQFTVNNDIDLTFALHMQNSF